MKYIVKLVFMLLVLSMSVPAMAIVNLNQADAETIAATMKGVGLSKAKAIVSYRNEHGPFEQIDDLVHVKGIGQKTVEKNRDNMTVEAVAE